MNLKKTAVSAFVLGFAFLPLWAGVQLKGPGIGEMEFSEQDLFKVKKHLSYEEYPGKQHALAVMYDGYLIQPQDPDIVVFDLSNPVDPKPVFSGLKSFGMHRFSMSGSIACLADGKSLILVDFADPHNPVQRSHTPVAKEYKFINGIHNTASLGHYVYVTKERGGIGIVDISDPDDPQLVKAIPPEEIGAEVDGLNIIGNRMVLVTQDSHPQKIVVMDISDPVNPTVISNWFGEWKLEDKVLNKQNSYSSVFSGPMVYTLGVKGQIASYDALSDPLDPRLVNLNKSLGRGGYGTFQDGYVIAGFSGNVGKVKAEDLSIAGALAKDERPHADMDFATAVGNLIYLGDDHKNGSFIIPHSTTPDKISPEVNWVQPRPGDKNIATTSCVGVSFTDQLDVKSIGETTFKLRPVDGEPLKGVYSYNHNTANFCPETPLDPNTTYEIFVAEGGIIDMSGNAFKQNYVSAFSTGDQLDTPTTNMSPYQIRARRIPDNMPQLLINGKTVQKIKGTIGSLNITVPYSNK